jgi:hypothetical protein
MRLTAEQVAEIERQRQAAPGTHSFHITMTPQQRSAYRQAVAEELAARAENLERLRQIETAEQEATLSGALRRAISDSRRSPRELSAELGIDSRLLSAFREGLEPLPSDVIDKLVAILDLDVIVANVNV